MQGADQIDLEGHLEKVEDAFEQLSKPEVKIQIVNPEAEPTSSDLSNKRDDVGSSAYDKSLNISNFENNLKPIADSLLVTKKTDALDEISLLSDSTSSNMQVDASHSPKGKAAPDAESNLNVDASHSSQFTSVPVRSQNTSSEGNDAVEDHSSRYSNDSTSPSRKPLETEESPKRHTQVDDLKRRGRAFLQGIVDNFTTPTINRISGGVGDSEEQSVQRELQIKEDTVAWNQLLQNWANKAEIPSQKRLQSLCWRGIPSSCRGGAWFAIIGNDLKITRDLYKILLARTKSSTVDASSKEDSASLIEVDAPRTFPELQFFHGDGPLRAPLVNILKTYVSFRPDVGYIQGMSYIAAMLLLNLDDECNAFISLANLLNRELYFTLFRDFQSGRAHLNVFDKLFQKHVPRCAQKFKQLQLTSDMYLYDWILTIFSRSFPLDIACRIWDCFLVYGQVFMFRAALGVLKMYERAFLQSNFEQCLHLLNKIPRNMDETILFQNIQSISISDKSLNAMLAKVQTIS